MKKEKRIKKQLTSKQVAIISMVIAIVCGIIASFVLKDGIDPNIDPNSELGIFANVMVSFLIAFLVWMFVYIVVLQGNKKEYKEREEALQTDVKKFLCTGTFTELLFTPKNNGAETQMILGILKEAGCRFFAKLDEKENIILIVYDKDGKEVWKEKIENYFYFEAKFKQKK